MTHSSPTLRLSDLPRRLTVRPRASPSPRSALWLGAVALSLALVGADVPRTRAPAAALAATAVRVEPIEARGRDEIEDRFADALAGDFARFAKASGGAVDRKSTRLNSSH